MQPVQPGLKSSTHSLDPVRDKPRPSGREGGDSALQALRHAGNTCEGRELRQALHPMVWVRVAPVTDMGRCPIPQKARKTPRSAVFRPNPTPAIPTSPKTLLRAVFAYWRLFGWPMMKFMVIHPLLVLTFVVPLPCSGSVRSFGGYARL